MRPRRSLTIARIFGIRVSVGISWFAILFIWIIFATPYFHEVLGGSHQTAYLVTVASVLSFFLSLVMHELGHAVVARRNGLQVLGIELWALGGLTRTRGAAESPGVQFRVAAAGPAVTVAVVGVSALLGVALASDHHFFAVATGTAGLHSTPAAVWLGWVMALNVLVLALNLVPAFPLDGGQIAHALVWWRTGDRNLATRLTGRIGQGFALLVGAGGLFLLAAPATRVAGVYALVLALFLYQGAGAAVAQGVLGARMQQLTVGDIMDREPVTIPAQATLLDAQEQFFGRYRWPWFAVVDPARHFLGVVRAQKIEEEIAAGRPALAVVDALEQDMAGARIDEREPLESLLRSEALARLGGVVAVDREGTLRGVVTLAQVRRALRLAPGSS